jgi:hypothetical protein
VPVRSILAVVRDAVAHTPPVLAACAELRGVAGESRVRVSGAVGTPACGPLPS